MSSGAIEGTDFDISGQYVTRLLGQAVIFDSYPNAVRTDTGPEFTGRVFMASTQAHDIRLLLIEPGRPMRNGCIESFNGKFRCECHKEADIILATRGPNRDAEDG